MGIVGALGTLPDLLLGLPAGALADRWDRRRMMLWADLGRALLTALVPLSVLWGWDTMTVVVLVTAPINALRVVYMAAFTAVMPSLVGREQVGRAAGYTEAILSVSFMLGPVLAGLLVGVIGAASTLALDAATFAVSAASLAFVRRPLQASRGRRRPRIVSDIVEGVCYVAGERTLRASIAFWSAYSVITAPLTTAVIFLLTIDGGAAPGVVGLILGAHAAGWLVGALVAGRTSRGPLGLVMLLATAAQVPILVLFALVPWLGTVAGPDTLPVGADVRVALQAILAAGAGAFGALTLIAYLTVRTTIPPDDMLGRVGSSARTISVGLTPLGIFLGGLALDVVGGTATLLLMGLLVGLVVAAFAFSPALRNARAGTGGRPASPAPT
jgi:MFS family permease